MKIEAVTKQQRSRTGPKMRNRQVFNSDDSSINLKKIWIITCDTWVAKVTLSSQLMFAHCVTLSPWRSCPCDFADMMQLQALLTHDSEIERN